MIVDVLPLTTRLLMLLKGPEYLEGLFRLFQATVPPEQFASAEARAFARFLRAAQVDVQYLPEVLAFEEASVDVVLDNLSVRVPFSHDPTAILQALSCARVPPALAEGYFEVEITP
jgi:hypothetical protein